jgi:hypothetical protein
VREDQLEKEVEKRVEDRQRKKKGRRIDGITRQNRANQPPEKQPKWKREGTDIEKRNNLTAEPGRRPKKGEP